MVHSSQSLQQTDVKSPQRVLLPPKKINDEECEQNRGSYENSSYEWGVLPPPASCITSSEASLESLMCGLTSERDGQMGLNDTVLRSATTMNQRRQGIMDAEVHFKPKKQDTKLTQVICGVFLRLFCFSVFPLLAQNTNAINIVT